MRLGSYLNEIYNTLILLPYCIVEFCSINFKNIKKMATENLILDKLTEIANKLDEQNLLQKQY